MLLSNSNMSINLKSISLKTDLVLPSAKLCIDAISMNKNKSLNESFLRYTEGNFVIVKIWWFKDIINPYNCLLKNGNFSVKTTDD